MTHSANTHLELGPVGQTLIQKWEGLKLQAYLDTEGIPTIGYGTTSATGIPVKLGMKITRQQAAEYLITTVRKIYGAAVKKHVKVPLRQIEYDVLCCFTYNVGEGALAKSTLLRKLNSGDYASVPAELMKWVNSRSGNARTGLTRRRQDEGYQWMKSGRFARLSLVSETTEPENDNPQDAVEFARTRADEAATPSAEKPVVASTTMQAATAVTLSAATLAADKSEQLMDWLSSGNKFQVILAVVMVTGFLWMAYARLYRDQDALVRT